MTRIYTEWRQVKVKREDKGNLQFLLKKNKGFMDTSLLKSLMLNIKCIIISLKHSGLRNGLGSYSHTHSDIESGVTLLKWLQYPLLPYSCGPRLKWVLLILCLDSLIGLLNSIPNECHFSLVRGLLSYVYFRLPSPL